MDFNHLYKSFRKIWSEMFQHSYWYLILQLNFQEVTRCKHQHSTKIRTFVEYPMCNLASMTSVGFHISASQASSTRPEKISAMGFSTSDWVRFYSCTSFGSLNSTVDSAYGYFCVRTKGNRRSGVWFRLFRVNNTMMLWQHCARDVEVFNLSYSLGFLLMI